MRNFRFGTTTFALISLLLTTMAQAGTAYVPYWQHNPAGMWALRVSNPSAVEMNVTITLYQQNGALYTGSVSSSNGGQINAPFVLAPFQTALVRINQPSSSLATGYGVIEGSPVNAGAGSGMLVAYAMYSDQENYDRWLAIPINASRPF